MTKFQICVFVFIFAACYVAAFPVGKVNSGKEHTEVKGSDSTATQTETAEAHADREDRSKDDHGQFKGHHPHTVMGNHGHFDKDHHREGRSAGDHRQEPHHGHRDVNHHKVKRHNEQKRDGRHGGG